jgi:radical SAM protein with 4Fe4S-binding SPASM domain
MIGFTKLLCGVATIGEALNYGRESDAGTPAHLLQFTTADKPLVAWNTTRRCNLRCLHCYLDSEDKDYADELTTEQAKAMIDDLAEMGCPVLLFSGGEPFLRKDLFELGEYAIAKGIRAVISSNGTLIDDEKAKRVAEIGFSYVGISIDGARETHDHFRQKEGAFDAAIRGIQACTKAGVKAGVRLTVNQQNYKDLEEVLDLVEKYKIPRFCMYHLVYSGRGKEIADQDLTPDQAREVVRILIEKAYDWHERGIETEILTTDNHADGVLVEKHIRKVNPERAAEVAELQKLHGGCSAGRKFANVDWVGNVHACQFWNHVTLGNVKERKFSEIWTDEDNTFLQNLKHMQQHVSGERCGSCNYKATCGGCRIRAEAITGDMWGDDPACYLTDEEIKS